MTLHDVFVILYGFCGFLPLTDCGNGSPLWPHHGNLSLAKDKEGTKRQRWGQVIRRAETAPSLSPCLQRKVVAMVCRAP